MILDTNHRILLGENEKYTLFKRVGDLETSTAPIETIRSAPERLLAFEDIESTRVYFLAEAERSEFLANTAFMLKRRLDNYSYFILRSRELVELLISVTARAYMVSDFWKPNKIKSGSWDLLKRELTLTYRLLDNLLSNPSNSLRLETVNEIRRLFEIISASIPHNPNENLVYGFSEDIIETLDHLMMECEVSSIMEES